MVHVACRTHLGRGSHRHSVGHLPATTGGRSATSRTQRCASFSGRASTWPGAGSRSLPSTGSWVATIQIQRQGVRRIALSHLLTEVHRPGVAPRGTGRGTGEKRVLVDAEDAQSIGARARMIRRRRGLSLDVVAGLAGISTPYLSMLERGQRGFNRRGLLEDLAGALSTLAGRLAQLDKATSGSLLPNPTIFMRFCRLAPGLRSNEIEAI
jgi:hypothetical protein